MNHIGTENGRPHNGQKRGLECSVRGWLAQLLDFIISPLNPVKRHRILYGWRWGWILYSVFIVFFIVLLLRIISGCLGLQAIDLLGQEPEDEDCLSWAIISQFADPGNLHMAQDNASMIAFICALFGVACLSGLIVSSLVSFISRRRDDWQNGLIFYNRPLGKYFCFNDYVVIIGVNKQTATIVKSSLRRGIKYVLIQSNRNIEQVRMQVNLFLNEVDEKRVVFYHGERTSEEDIKDLRLQDANEVYILGEDILDAREQDHDAYNIACLELIANNIRKYGRKSTKWWGWKVARNERLKCHVNFEYQSTFMAFKFTHIYQSMNDKVEFLPFNIHDIWAKKVLVDNCATISSGKYSEEKCQEYYPLDMYLEKSTGTGTWNKIYINETSSKTVHLVVVGMNQMGVALGMQTALLVHLPNYHVNHANRTTITFIDDNAVREGEYLRSRYDALFSLCRYRSIKSNNQSYDTFKHDYQVSWEDPMLNGRYAYMGENFMDLQWEFIEGNVASSQIRAYVSSLVERKDETCTIAVCFNNPQQSIATALYFPEVVLKRSLQILVYQQNSFDMIHKIATTEKEWKRYEKLKPFGMIEGCYQDGMLNNKIAKMVNLVYKDDILKLSLQDVLDNSYSQRADQLWQALGIVDKYANIDLADSFGMKLHSLGNSEEEQRAALKQDEKVHLLAEAEHLRWVTERLTMGYRPLDLEELNLLQGEDKIKYTKDYYKKKSRAHLDICSGDDLIRLDKAASEKNMDERIIKMILDLRTIASHI